MNKNNTKSKSKLLENKNFVFLISLIASFLLWMVLTATATPQSENTISGIAVNIPTENSAVSELGLDIIGDIDVISAKVVGPAYVVSSLSADDIVVTANLSNVTSAGKFTLDLRASKKSTNVSKDYEIASIYPSTVTVTFDYIDTKQFAVTAKAIGASAIEGLSAEDAIVANANTSVISIKGPRSEIEKIDKVVAAAEVNKVLDKTATFETELTLYDVNENALSLNNCTIFGADNQPVNKVEVTVPIFKHKNVPLVPEFVNTPADYKDKPIPYSLSDSSVLISGQPEVIDSVSQISLSSINFDDITNSNYTFEVTPVLPEGVKCVENIENITVTLASVQNYSLKTFDVSALNISAGNAKTSLVRSIRNVKLMGPKAVMKELTSSALYAEVDTTGKETGQHTVTVRIKCRTSNSVWQVGTYTATIKIE